ncbi:hypothetical protein [Streptomyces alkaliterrae]|uniref:Lipoprotein n=1 Tax=Streptomyces alkaliterrae TaxID=2213162 RepID=A0A5P0YMN9_9ACTN|nr:hypothetical protein [Streptomyces alkaliterrae]MBB1257824.1 hypothetical protein [Streptomyces alkaliterrae]MQS01180.1 hypothetical protein [Streptomyces alkaliterrae]
MSGRKTGRSAAAAAALCAALLLAGCGGSGDGGNKGGERGGSAEQSSAEDAEELTEAANKAMRTTTFRASGSTTAFPDGRQEMWSDPDAGIRIEVTAAELPGGKSEIYCAKGQIYTGVPLFAAQLAQRGEKVEVPEKLEAKFVRAPSGGDCSRLYEIFPGAERSSALDTRVDGQDTRALVNEAQGNKDVYHVAKDGTPYVLRLDSTYDGRESRTTYGSFGKKMEITPPKSSDTVSLEQFRDAIKTD